MQMQQSTDKTWLLWARDQYVRDVHKVKLTLLITKVYGLFLLDFHLSYKTVRNVAEVTFCWIHAPNSISYSTLGLGPLVTAKIKIRVLWLLPHMIFTPTPRHKLPHFLTLPLLERDVLYGRSLRPIGTTTRICSRHSFFEEQVLNLC